MQHRRTLVFGLTLLATAGCDVMKIGHRDDIDARATALAEAYCDAYQACDCGPIASDALFSDPGDCMVEQRAWLIPAFEEAEDRGLEFDQGCMDQMVARYGQLGCGDRPSVQLEFGAAGLQENFGCMLYHGERELGACESVLGAPWSECAAGMGCFGGACQSLGTTAAEGEPCTHDYSAYASDCAPGLYCGADESCRPFIASGDPCSDWGSDPQRCAPDHRCAIVSEDPLAGICTPLLAAGDPCNPTTHSDCPAWCVGTDANDPTIGECVDAPAVCYDPELPPLAA
jgi:hypothetical protein